MDIFYTIENANFITNFADYLRGNMDFASLNTTIPFEKELNHTRIYTEIEALRFNNIKFEFNVDYLNGKPMNETDCFAGEYMNQYSWGEDSIYRFE